MHTHQTSEFDFVRFGEFGESAFAQELWKFLNRPDNVIRMETASMLERAAVEPLAPGLVAEFGEDISDDRAKQLCGAMVRKILEARGYRLDKKSLRIRRANLFTTGATYTTNPREDRSMQITKEQREKWVRDTKNSPFNIWLDSQVKVDGILDLDRLYEVAKGYGVTKRYDQLNPGQQRMNIGVQLRKAVDPAIYGENA